MAILCIEDDGVGFSVSEQTQAVGHGLANMRARAEELNGVFFIQSTPGEGTQICLRLPILASSSATK
jgi:signal transduction histidine kinase